MRSLSTFDSSSALTNLDLVTGYLLIDLALSITSAWFGDTTSQPTIRIGERQIRIADGKFNFAERLSDGIRVIELCALFEVV